MPERASPGRSRGQALSRPEQVPGQRCSEAAEMAADGRDGQIGISWSGPPAPLNHWARSGRHGL